MDTPEKKTQIGTPLSKSKFEESPVFNYINNLSPIRPVKSVHIAQPFNPLGFSSVPSVFTSPHVNFHKESRFFKIHNSPDPSKHEVLSEHGSKPNEAVFAAESSDPRNLNSCLESPGENFELELQQVLNFDCGSPECETTTCAAEEGEVGDKCLSDVGLDLQKMCNTIAKDETRDWEDMISDAAELLIFCSPKDSEAFTGIMKKNPTTGLSNNLASAARLNQAREGGSNDEFEVSVPHSCENVSNIHRGMRRRCLDFEMLGSRRRSSSSSSIDNQTPFNKPGRDSSLCILPGIGLHLNALAMKGKNSKESNGKIQINLPGTKEQSDPDMAAAEKESTEEGMPPAVDVSKNGEDLNPSSPRKKRRKPEQIEEEGSCKRCNCKKSKCLKLYCECFAAGVYCIGSCSCQDCLNKPIHEGTVLAARKQIESRNPLAFAPKVVRSSEAVSDIGDDSSKTPASARHKRGCNCKKSNCLKKYCECYQSGVGCSINCRCEGCKNAYGRKDGTLTGPEREADEEHEMSEKIDLIRTLPTSEIQKEEQKLSSAIPTTPIPLYRSFVLPPFSSKARLPQSLLGAGTSSSGFYGIQTYGKSEVVVPTQSRFDKNFESLKGDDEMEMEMEMPEILVRSPMAATTIKTASPNSKRVSSPQFGSSGCTPGRRKLILQSIPSFPSLTPKH